jgi:tetratricopeptide (TPR) repeat protein
MGYCIVVACLFRAAYNRIGKVTGAVLIVALVLLSARTVERNAVWKSDYTLHSTGAREVPQNIKLVTNFGMLIHERAKEKGRSDEERKALVKHAEQVYQQGIVDIGDVKFPNLYFTYGNLLQETERYDDALKVYEEGLRRKDHTRTTLNLLNNMGMLHYKLKNYDSAEESFLACIDIDEGHYSAHNGLGVLYASMNRKKEGEATFLRLLAIKPDYHEARFNYGTMLAQMDSRIDDAEAEFNKVLAVNPAHSGAKSNLKYVAHMKEQVAKKAARKISDPAGRVVQGTVKH